MKQAHVLLVLVLVGAAAGTLPGFKGFLTQKALNYATKIGLEILEQKLSTIAVPDVTGDKDSITYTISEIVIHNLKIPEGAVKIDTSVGIIVSVDDISAEITAKWDGREDHWPHPSGHGDATIDVSSTNMEAVIELYNNAGKLDAEAKSVSVSIGHLDLHFSGSGLDFLLNLLKDIFSNKIKEAAENSIKNAIVNAIDKDLDAEIRTLPDIVPIGKSAELDFSLVSNPLFDATVIQIPLSGTFYEIAHKTPPPYTPTQLPDEPSTSDMVQAYFSEYVVNTASYAFYKAGKMQVAVTNSEIPPSAPINLNTSTWASIVPALYKTYPNWLMKMVAVAMDAPAATFTAKGASVFGKGSLEIYVINPTTKALKPAFTLGMNVSASGQAYVKGNYITGNLTYIDSGVWLEKSYIGDFSVASLRSIVKFLTLVVVLPYFNHYLGEGIPIPSVDGIDFIEPQILYGDGFVAVSTNMKYNGAPLDLPVESWN